GQDDAAPIFSEAPAHEQAAAAPRSKVDQSAAVVVDLKKPIQIVDDIPPMPVEVDPARSAPAVAIPAASVTETLKPVEIPATAQASVRGARSFKEILELPDSEFDVAEAVLALG